MENLPGELVSRIRGRRGPVVATGEDSELEDLTKEILIGSESVFKLAANAMIAAAQNWNQWKAIASFDPIPLILIPNATALTLVDSGIIQWLAHASNDLGSLWLMTAATWQESQNHPFVGPMLSGWVEVKLPLNEDDVFSVGDLGGVGGSVEMTVAAPPPPPKMSDGVLQVDALASPGFAQKASRPEVVAPAPPPVPQAGAGVSRNEFLRRMRKDLNDEQ